MKGFIEVHDKGSGAPILVGLNVISFVEKAESKEGKNLGTMIRIAMSHESWISVTETYDEVKALIMEALNPAPGVKFNSIKCSGGGMAVGVVEGGLTIDHRSRTTMHQNASTVVNLGKVQTLKLED